VLLFYVSIPFMLLGYTIAVFPVLWGTFRFHREDDDSALALIAGGGTASEIRSPAPTGAHGVVCPVCSAYLAAEAKPELLNVVRRHAWREHGIPSDEHVLESARSA
jgi:hypothetical protein